MKSSNKKAQELNLSTLIPLILGVLIIGILALLLYFYGQPLANKLLGFGPEQIKGDTTSLEKEAKKLFEDYEKCLKSNIPSGETDCMCMINIRNYPKNYAFLFSADGIKLYNKYSDQKIINKQFNGKLFCYITIKENKITKEYLPIRIEFSGQPYLIFETLMGEEKHNLPYEFTEEKIFYKEDGNVCFISPDLIDMDNLKLKKCE